MRFNEMLEGTKAELAVKIFGNDYDVLEKARRADQDHPRRNSRGVSQVEFETEGRTPQLLMNVKRDVLQRYGLQAARSEQGRQRRAGGPRGRHHRRRASKRHDIVVRMPEQLRADDEQIKKLPVRVGEAGLVPLGQLVRFQTLKTVEPIRATTASAAPP